VDFLGLAITIGEPDLRDISGQVEHRGVGHRVVDFPAVPLAGGREVDEHFVLRVEPPRFPDQVLEIDAVTLA
jgi:hypothetical protein